MIPDPEDALLRQLPAHDVGSGRREHIRRRAHEVLSQRQRRPIVFRASAAYHRFVEPAALVTLGLAYLTLTLQRTLAVFQ